MARKAGQLISRGSRTWLVRISLGRDPETGSRKYHNKTVRGSFREAQTYLSGKLQEREIGRLPRAAAISLNQYLDQWLATAAKPRPGCLLFTSCLTPVNVVSNGYLESRLTVTNRGTYTVWLRNGSGNWILAPVLTLTVTP